MPMRILIIEDDAGLAQSIQAYLQNDFEVTIASNGSGGLNKFGRGQYQLVLLDLTLPDMTGLTVCQELRRLEQETPILVLTGTTDVETQIRLLDAGADDYVAKPFNGRQLRARIDALLRRAGIISKSILKTHDLAIDTRARQVKRGDAVVSLRRKEYDILEYLTRNKGRAMTRAMIFDNVWHTEGWPDSIDVHIKHLRDKIDRPFGEPLIETVHGIGYLVRDLPAQ